MSRKEPLYPHIPKSRQARVIPTEPRRPRDTEVLEFMPDSEEDMAQTVKATGYQNEIGNAFRAAINRSKGRKR